ncbi:MAG: divalent cation tolerance protein CutA [Dehalococcoidia bacterium]
MIVKTKASLLDELVRLVKENHSYEVPEVVALPISGGNPDYLKWIDEVTSPK